MGAILYLITTVIADSAFDDAATLKRRGIERVDVDQNGRRVQTIEIISLFLNRSSIIANNSSTRWYRILKNSVPYFRRRADDNLPGHVSGTLPPWQVQSSILRRWRSAAIGSAM